MLPDATNLRTFVLAAGDFDVELLIYGAIFVASILGGLLKKKKKPEEQVGRIPTPPKPAPRPVPRRPAPRPESVSRPPVSARPAPPPVPPWQRPPVRPPAPVVRAPAPPPEPEPIVAEVIEAERPRPAPPPPGPATPVSPLLGQLDAILHDRTQLQIAFVLSEVLAPPLSLREDDQQR